MVLCSPIYTEVINYTKIREATDLGEFYFFYSIFQNEAVGLWCLMNCAGVRGFVLL